MLDPPKVEALLKPLPLLPCLLGCKADALDVAVGHALQDLHMSPGGKRNSVQRLVTLHPSRPLMACLVEQNPPTPRKLFVVQDLQGRIQWNLLAADLITILYGEHDVKKIPAAIASLGTILSLEFFDCDTLKWDHMALRESSIARGLLVQTSQRILLLNLNPQVNSPLVPHPSQLSSRILWHLHQGNLGAVPSSNVLALTSTWFLVGCKDGSLKCWDAASQTTIKSIKGLGKGDWIVGIQSACSHCQQEDNECRILTRTKKGMAYLIQVGLGQDSVEINPPLARFMGDETTQTVESQGDENTPLTSTLLYDSHRDWVSWIAPPPTRKDPTKLLVWNLLAQRAEFLQQKQKTLLQPQPHLVITLPTTEHALAVASVVHVGWEQDTVILAAVTSVGELYVMGATGDFKSPQQVRTTPLLAVSLSELLKRDAGLDDPPVNLKATGIVAHELLPKCAVTTNFGVMVLDMPSALLTGSRHLHFGAGLGSLGKSVLTIQKSHIIYGSLDVVQANPVGHLPAKNPISLYECAPSLQLPPQVSKRPFGSQPLFLQSPTGNYVALVWPQEFRYEILHTASLLQAVGNRSASATNRSPLVDKGHGVSHLAWVGDSDVYAILHAPDLVRRAHALAPRLMDESQTETTLDQLQQVANLTNIVDIRSYSKNVVKLGAGLTKGAVSATMNVTNTATEALTTTAKAGMKTTTAVTSKTLSVAKAATDKSLDVATGSVKKIAKVSNKGLKKATFGLFGGKKKKQDSAGLGMAADDEEEMSEAPTAMTVEMQEQMLAQTNEALRAIEEEAASQKRHVELKSLDAISASAPELGASAAAATSHSLGELQVRGENRSPPFVLFGGPVLCVANRTEGENGGFAHFYTRKPGEEDDRATVYTTSGPALPFPDLCVWDDDGALCAIVVKSHVSIFLLDPPNFSLLGTVQIGSINRTVTNVKFIHGVLYCCTWDEIYVVFLGEHKGGANPLDVYLLASADAGSQHMSCGLMPVPLSMPLMQPSILGYQNGSLIVSTARGVVAVPLSNVLLRIGSLLASGQVERALGWFDAVEGGDQEELAVFLERRGYPELAVDLPCLSLETTIDICMRFGYIERLEEVVENYGVRGLWAIDQGRGIPHRIFGPVSDSGSLLICVGAYLLAHGRVELVRRLATECLRFNEAARKDALILGSLLLSVNEADATRLIHRAVENPHPDWLIGNYTRDYILNNNRA